MKCLLLADERMDLLATLEPVLKHWGYRVLTASNISQANAFLAESKPAMIIAGSNLLASGEMAKHSPGLPLVALDCPDHNLPARLATTILAVPVDIFALFAIIQDRVERHPRQNLRLRLRLPGMYCLKGDDYILADVLSLSMCGLFFKSPIKLNAGDRVAAVLPLLGHGKELEIDGRVLYTVEPAAENNYVQGFGLGFNALTTSQVDCLQRFLADSFLNEVSASQPGVGNFSPAQLRQQ